MAKFTIDITAGIFHVFKQEIVTGSSTLYRYTITATNADMISLALTGTFAGAMLTQNLVAGAYVDGTFTFNNTMKVEFSVPNSGTAGVYNSATITIDDTTILAPNYNQYTDTVINLTDSGASLPPSWSTKSW